MATSKTKKETPAKSSKSAAEPAPAEAKKPAPKAEPAAAPKPHPKAEAAKVAPAAPASPLPSVNEATPSDDVAGAEAAYAKLEARLTAMPDDKAPRPTIDVQAAALVAIGAAERLEDKGRRATVEALAKLGLAKLDLVDGLRDVALAAWHARHKLLEVTATETKATLSPETRAQALDCRKRMREVLEYNVKDPATLDVLRFLRSGRGDLDLANDLVGYARLYRERRVDLERDKVNYRANDEALAKRLAGDIGKRLGSAETSEAKAWQHSQSAAFALLVEHHAEAARLGRFVERDDAGAIYPSLWVATRDPAKRADKPAPTEKPAG